MQNGNTWRDLRIEQGPKIREVAQPLVHLETQLEVLSPGTPQYTTYEKIADSRNETSLLRIELGCQPFLSHVTGLGGQSHFHASSLPQLHLTL